MMKRYRIWRYTRQQKKEAKLVSKTAATTLPLQHFSTSTEGTKPLFVLSCPFMRTIFSSFVLFSQDNSKNKQENREESCQREDSIKSQPTPAILRVGSVNSNISRKDQTDHEQVSTYLDEKINFSMKGHFTSIRPKS